MVYLRQFLLTVLTVTALGASVANAQVLTASAETRGVDCEMCVPPIESALRRERGIRDVAINVSTETVEVAYTPDASFDPKPIRRAVAIVRAEVKRLSIVADGTVEHRDSGDVLIAGKSRFRLGEKSIKVPVGKLINVEGTVDDSGGSMTINVTHYGEPTVKPPQHAQKTPAQLNVPGWLAPFWRAGDRLRRWVRSELGFGETDS